MTVTLAGASAKATGVVTDQGGHKILATKAPRGGKVTFKLPKLKTRASTR